VPAFCVHLQTRLCLPLSSLLPQPSSLPSPLLSPARRSGEPCKLTRGVQGGASAHNSFLTILPRRNTSGGASFSTFVAVDNLFDQSASGHQYYYYYYYYTGKD